MFLLLLATTVGDLSRARGLASDCRDPVGTVLDDEPGALDARVEISGNFRWKFLPEWNDGGKGAGGVKCRAREWVTGLEQETRSRCRHGCEFGPELAGTHARGCSPRPGNHVERTSSTGRKPPPAAVLAGDCGLTWRST